MPRKKGYKKRGSNEGRYIYSVKGIEPITTIIATPLRIKKAIRENPSIKIIDRSRI